MMNRNRDALDDYIGAMFGASVPSTPLAGALFPHDLEPIGKGQSLQCTWTRAPTRGDAVVAALLLWQMFHHLPQGRLRTRLRHRGLVMLNQCR